MLYSIIPPALVVLSLAGIIVFLFKKSRKVAELSLASKEESNGIAGDSLGRKNFSVFFGSGKFLVSKSTEKIRKIFLGMGRKFVFWGESLREKRKINQEKKSSDSTEKKDFFDYVPREKSFGKFGFPRKGVEKETEEDFDLPEKIKNPSRETDPEFFRRSSAEKETVFPAEEKSQLEDALIERIASNPKDTEAYERLGQYYFEIGNYDHAKECYKQVMKLSPGNIGVRSRMRKLERMLGG